MAQALHSGTTSTTDRPMLRVSHPTAARGFTLIEMMVVVVIVGVLATLAVVGYRKIVESAHVSEATGMVHNIRVAQEAYHSEAQGYANISKDVTSWYPATPAHAIQTGWGAACGSKCVSGVDWSMLPLHVDGPVLFGYVTVAGTPGTNPPATITYQNAVATVPQNIPTDWYVIAAAADLDSVSTTGTLVVGGSWTNQISVLNEGQ
jgi:type IV pilus assembly protein PilA